jgi:8-oxo-dGTP pyrophosphatase MutT (NUDIX family)
LQVERDETDLQAAYRETQEETGLAAGQLQLLSSSPIDCGEYWDAKLRKNKSSVYFVAELTDERAVARPNASIGIANVRRGQKDEIADCEWLPLEPGKARAGYREMRDVLEEAAALIDA